MQPKTAKRLLDAYTAATHIREFTVGTTFSSFERDVFFRSAVERQLEIVAEALNVAAREDNRVKAWIPELAIIVGLRNRLVHGYDAVDDEIVWDTVMNDIPELHERLHHLLTNPPPGDDPIKEPRISTP